MDSNTSRKNSNRKNSNRKNSDRKNSDRKNSDRKASTRSNESGNGKNERKTSSSKRKNSNNSEDGHDLTNLSQEELDALYDSEEGISSFHRSYHQFIINILLRGRQKTRKGCSDVKYDGCSSLCGGRGNKIVS